MNTIHHASSALLAGVFLNLGLVRLAEWFDPVSSATAASEMSTMPAAMPCANCGVPAAFSKFA